MDHREAVKHDRERETSKAVDALNSNPGKLVEEIFVNSNSRELSEAGLISRPLAYFSDLIVQLSKKAENIALANKRLQRKMVVFTWTIAVLTLVMVAGLIYQILCNWR